MDANPTADPSAVEDVQACDRVGPTDAPRILLLHGAGISKAMWAPQRTALADDYRVIAPDLPGHGARDEEPFAFDRAVEVVVDALEREGDEAVLVVGHSLGGYVAVELAHRRPDLVRALVLSGSSADYRGALGRRAAFAGRLNGLLAKVPGVERLYRDRSISKLASTPLSRAQVNEIVSGGISFGALAEGGRTIANYESRSKLAAFDGPVLLINGEQDRVNEAGLAAELAASLADADHVTIPGAGHAVSMQAPDAFTDAVRGFAKRVFDANRQASADQRVDEGRSNGRDDEERMDAPSVS